MMKSLTEALRLVDQALALLDAVGDVEIVPHLDLAAHRLRERLEKGCVSEENDADALKPPGASTGKPN